jgi:hypothetical protein
MLRKNPEHRPTVSLKKSVNCSGQGLKGADTRLTFPEKFTGWGAAEASTSATISF